MIAKLVVEGKEFDIEILDPKLQELIVPKKKTGYERSNIGDLFFWDLGYKMVDETDSHNTIDDEVYSCANYYSDQTVAENNARADKLMRQLRRFAVEHRTKDNPSEKFYIYYMKQVGLQVARNTDKYIGPWFDTLHAAAQAIEAFKDELIWYFTEYKDSL